MKLPKFSKALRRIGRMLRGAAFGVAFGACSVGLSFGGLGFGLSEGSSVVQTPLTLPGFAALSIWLNAAKNITLGGTMKSTGFVAGGVVTLTGTLAQTTTSCVPRVVVQTTGTVGVFTFNLSTDGGQTYTFGITSAATYLIPGTAITINFAAGTYNAGAVYEATVSQIVSQDTNAWVFASSTAGNSPIITYFNGRPALKFDGTSILRCSTAGVAAVFAGDDLPYTFFVSAQPSSLTSLKTFLSAANTAGGNPFINFFTNGALWQINKHDNGGTTGDVSGGVPVIDTLYTLEGFSTGTAASLIANGATVINAAAQNVGTCSSANCVSIGATNLSNTPGNFGNCYLNEVIVYSGNQHAVAGTTTTAYLNTRNAALASTAIADSFFFDNKAVTQGTSPSTVAPNDYKQRDPFARLKGTVGAGVTSLTVWAVPSLDPVGTEGSFTRVGVWIDGVYSQTLTFAGALGLRQSQVLSLDGSAHTIEFENQASIVGIDGAIALSSSAVPNTRVIVRGDSISIGHNASSTPYKGWTAIMRHALAQATYGTTIVGISGRRLFDDAGDAGKVTTTTSLLTARADGSSKNIIVLALGTNDYGDPSGITAANFQTWLGNLVTSIHAAAASAKILLFSPVNRTVETANAGGSTLPDFRTAVAAVQAANPTFCTLLNGNGIINPATDTYDGLHPTDAGYALIATAVKTAVEAL